MIAVHPQRKMLPLLGSVEHHPECIPAFYHHSLLPSPARGSGHAPSACPPAGISSPGCPSQSSSILWRHESLSVACVCQTATPEPGVLTTCLPTHSSALSFRHEGPPLSSFPGHTRKVSPSECPISALLTPSTPSLPWLALYTHHAFHLPCLSSSVLPVVPWSSLRQFYSFGGM